MHTPRLRALGSVVLVLGLLAAPRPAAAELKVCPICGRVTGDDTPYATKAGTTLTRGVANTVFGWTELIRQPAAEAKAGGNVFTGMAKGVGESVKRTLGGIGEVLTFWTPKVNNHYLAFSNDCPVCMKNKTKYGQPPAGEPTQ